MAATVTYPAIAVSKGDSFLVISALCELTTCTPYALRQGYFQSLSVYDCAGLLWPVVSAAPSRPLSVWDRLFNWRITVSVQFGEPRDDAKDIVLELLCGLIDNDPDDLYDQFVSHEELKEKFRAAQTPAELVEIARTLGAS